MKYIIKLRSKAIQRMNIQIPLRILQQVKRLQRSKSKQIYLQKCLDFLHKINYALPTSLTETATLFRSSILTGLPWGTSSSDHIPVYKLLRLKTNNPRNKAHKNLTNCRKTVLKEPKTYFITITLMFNFFAVLF